MTEKKKSDLKTRLHTRNKNREKYDLTSLVSNTPELKKHLKPNRNGEESVDFSSPIAVKELNKSLLNHYYGIKAWDFPDENLCPPIPGRADYIHHVADILCENNFGKIPTGNSITCFDIGIGASCIYPILGVVEYDWNFIGSDIDSQSIKNAEQIIGANSKLQNKIDCRLQTNPKDTFYNVITREDKIDISICNPPFHSSLKEAQKGTMRKIKNLTGKTSTKDPVLNFSGNLNELVYEGGEAKFIQNMIRQSEKFSKSCFWFTTLVSKQSNLKAIYKSLDEYKTYQVKTIPMGTGNKATRIVAWTFLNKEEQKQWRTDRWVKKQ